MDVVDVFEELESLVGVKKEAEEEEQKKGIINKVVDFVSSIFMPVIPAISGAGMLNVICSSIKNNDISIKKQRYSKRRKISLLFS